MKSFGSLLTKQWPGHSKKCNQISPWDLKYTEKKCKKSSHFLVKLQTAGSSGKKHVLQANEKITTLNIVKAFSRLNWEVHRVIIKYFIRQNLGPKYYIIHFKGS